jgi:hypothetical protein
VSYATVVAGLHERFATVNGLLANRILDYEPTSIQDFPTLYSLLDRFERGGIDGRGPSVGQVVILRYRILHRLCFRWQDTKAAELEVVPYVNAVPAAVDSDPQLGGRLVSNGASYSGGIARIAECQAGFATIGGALCRVLDFYSDTFEKFQYKTGGL